MTLSEATGTLKKFRRTPWKFQQTFLTPMQRLESYVSVIVSANQQMKSGCLTIEQAVFEPTHLIKLLGSYSLPPQYGPGISLTVTGQQEVEMLLLAIFSDWIDFIFVPEPKSFAMYADHDEYTTFFAHTRSNLNRVVKALTDKRFKMIPDYERRLRQVSSR
jgi:hypothetical protein